MFLVTTNKPKRLLHLSFIGHVQLEELQRGSKDIAELLADCPAGLRIIGDLERLESMEEDCAEELGKNMEMLDRHGVEIVARVVPDSTKDVGFNILMSFHYRNRPNVVTCGNMVEAAKALAL
ncbi:MAG TPA: hypothetical protein VFY06_10565 [Verrucomicrobiae bacterium]|nr:hypothetical protein [Verrucomicrobiae bacterium]